MLTRGLSPRVLSFGDTIFCWLQFVTDSFVTLVLGTLVLFLIFLVQGRNGEKDIETIKIFICIYIINFIYIIIYIKYYISTLHFWKQLKVPKYQVPKYYSCCFLPSSGKSIRLGLMARHARPDDPSGSAWSEWANFGAFYYTKIGVKNGGFSTFCLQKREKSTNFAIHLKMYCEWRLRLSIARASSALHSTCTSLATVIERQARSLRESTKTKQTTRALLALYL